MKIDIKTYFYTKYTRELQLSKRDEIDKFNEKLKDTKNTQRSFAIGLRDSYNYMKRLVFHRRAMITQDLHESQRSVNIRLQRHASDGAPPHPAPPPPAQPKDVSCGDNWI